MHMRRKKYLAELRKREMNDKLELQRALSQMQAEIKKHLRKYDFEESAIKL